MDSGLSVHTDKQAKGELPMLILTRRPGESIIIKTPAGEQITVRVLEVKGKQVRIGTDAPDDIAIVREELLDKLPAESWRLTKAHKKASARGCTRRRLVASFPKRVFLATHRTLHPCAVVTLLSVSQDDFLTPGLWSVARKAKKWPHSIGGSAAENASAENQCCGHYQEQFAGRLSTGRV